MTIVISVIKTFTYCIILKIIFFKFLKFKTINWPNITVITFFLLSIINYSKILDIFDYFLLHGLFLISYILISL